MCNTSLLLSDEKFYFENKHCSMFILVWIHHCSLSRYGNAFTLKINIVYWNPYQETFKAASTCAS